MPYKNRQRRIQYLREYRKKNSILIKKKRAIKYKKFRDTIIFKKRKQYQENKIEINAHRRKLYPKRREVIIQQVTNYYNRNKDKVHKKQKEWYLKNRDRLLLRAKIYHKKWYKKNRARRIKQLREYSKFHPDLRSTIHHNYISRKKEYGGSFTKEEWIAVKNSQKNLCKYCKKKKKLTVDHIIPSNKWKEWIKNNIVNYKFNDIKNIQALCGPCNSSKSDSI